MDLDKNNDLPEFDLEDILNEFRDPAQAEEAPPAAAEALPTVEEAPAPAAEAENAVPEEMPIQEEPTQRFDPAVLEANTDLHIDAVPAEDTVDISLSELLDTIEAPEAPEASPAPQVPEPPQPPVDPELAQPAFEVEETFIPSPVVFTPRSRLKELKKKLVAGPEKRYYELSETGVGRLQAAIFANFLLVLLCAGITTLFALDMVPENRLRLVIFSQVLALLVSGLLGSHLMIDALGDLLKGRFTVNTLLVLTFLACLTDGVFCLRELRVPCCAAFSLSMTMALSARYHRRTTEMAQMDTMRKAVRLHGLVRTTDYYEGRDGLVQVEGEVEDFMDTYSVPSSPEKLQSIYAFLSLLLCIAIAIFAGLTHSLSMAMQIFATSLLVAVPASFFIATTRPAAILEQRLHMVGTVLCGWQGVKGLGGRAAFPVDDQDLFPQGCTKLNGVKFYSDHSPEEVISYTTSLICKAGGGLVPVFQQLLTSRSGQLLTVENFRNYGDGGIGGEVNGEPVLLGSQSFLQDMGVEIPSGTMVSQAVYAAIDGQLCAVYAISYAKMRSAAAGLVTLCACRKVTPVMLCSDFMLTEDFIRAKFDVKTRRMVFPTGDIRTALKNVRPEAEAAVLALTTREELVSAAYAVSGARALRTSTRLGVAIHLTGGILGLLIMAVLALLGSTELLTPTNILLYQLIWAIPGLLITEWTRTV